MQNAQTQPRRNVHTTLAGRLRRHQVGSGGTPNSSTPTEPLEGSMKTLSLSELPDTSDPTSFSSVTKPSPQTGLLLPAKKENSNPTSPIPILAEGGNKKTVDTPSSIATTTVPEVNNTTKESIKTIQPSPTSPAGANTKNGGSRAMRGMLTQANNSTQESTPSSPQLSNRQPARPSATRNTPTFVSTSNNNTSSLNHRKLALWQQQPMNLSPATHLGLPPMLPSPLPHLRNKPLLVLDVDETLVHASFTPAKPYNVHIIIEVDGEQGDIFVAYRPHLFTFLDAIVDWFEVAIFTASQSCYADQLLDHIDPQGRLGRLRLFREHCTEINGARVKDLSLLGRPLHRVALVDNSPVTYVFQPRNGIPILSWFEDTRDVELLKLLPMLRQLAASESVYDVLDVWRCSQ